MGKLRVLTDLRACSGVHCRWGEYKLLNFPGLEILNHRHLGHPPESLCSGWDTGSRTADRCSKKLAAMDEPIQLSLPLPRSLDSRIYLHLTTKAKATVLFLTTASVEEAAAPTPFGSFVYAIPDVC